MGSKRSKSTCVAVKDAELDRISCVPGHIIDQILSYLPIKEAARTSVLSDTWRKKLYTLPNLVFDEHCVSNAASLDPSVINSKFVRIVDHVLLLHSGPINKFQICDDSCDLINLSSVADIQRWIIHLIRRSIKELVLRIQIGQYYKMPLCLFSCQSLHHLELEGCWLKPPTTFEGFKNLKSLELSHVTMTQYAFENMISNSPFLEKLRLFYLIGFSQINIHGPNLKVLHIDSEFEDISFDNTFRLAELTLYLYSRRHLRRLGGCSSNLLRFFVHLPHIQSLEIHHYFLEYLVAGVVPVKLPTPCINLRSLSLFINFDDLKEISAALCLLKSSPNLRKLEMIVPPKLTGLLTPTSYCWEDIFSEPTMPFKVHHVMMIGISGFKAELDFIRFLLLYSPVLEKMTVEPDLKAKPELVTELIRFKRTSGQAEVIYDVENSS